jgi:2-polyprenyl-3-methyl-5-hydroxy-6-metoxy-1,4-benzoquinol methylase
MSQIRFILPDRKIVEEAAAEAHSYAIKNYYGNGPIVYAKRRRFQRALNLANAIPAQNVIDMGTGDGVLLPTLANSYERVVAVDTNRHHIDQSQRLVRYLKLDNVELFCLGDFSFAELHGRIGPKFQLMFLLETLEHVGSQPNMWNSKMDFLRNCFSLLEREGRIIVTVPKMVGLIMLFKNLLQRCLRRGYDTMSTRQLLRSSFFKNTDELEPLWTGGHVGFNHLKLDVHLRKQFVVHHRSESLISVFYVLGRRNLRPS